MKQYFTNFQLFQPIDEHGMHIMLSWQVTPEAGCSDKNSICSQNIFRKK